MINEKVSILLLAHNEEKTIIKDILKINSFLRKSFLNFNIVISEDGSEDSTNDKILSLKKKLKLTICSSKKRKGYAKAFIDGVKCCNSNYIFFSDTGSKYNYSNFLKFYRAVKNENADLVSGIRIKRKDKLYRRLLTLFYSLFLNMLFLKKFSDFDCGFRIYNKKKLLYVLKKYSYKSSLINSQIFMYFLKNNFNIAQRKIIYYENKIRVSRGIPPSKLIHIIISSIIFSIKIRFSK
jgi:glycosyltransferase involved in cell wall biosynthesis